MAEYIERQDAIKTIRAYFESLPWNGLATTVADDCEKRLNDIPAGDVRKSVRGMWVVYPESLKYKDAYSDDQIVCPSCEEVFSILDNDTERFDFCPNCGADMRGNYD